MKIPACLVLFCLLAAVSPAAAETPLSTMDRGLEHLLAGDARAAVAVFEEGVALFPGNADLKLLLGTALNDTGAYQQAQEVLAAAVSQGVAFSVVVFEQGRAALGAGRYARALAFFESDLSVNPWRADSWLLAGAARYRLGEWDEAIAALDTAVAKEVRHLPLAWYYKGNCLIAAGRHMEAVPLLERVEKISAAGADNPYHTDLLPMVRQSLAAAREKRPVGDAAAASGGETGLWRLVNAGDVSTGNRVDPSRGDDRGGFRQKDKRNRVPDPARDNAR
jgi:tetratricopeptide (TPR) repeat protein